MRILVVHNRYRSELPSGENSVVDAEVEGLRKHGVEVVTYLRSSNEIAHYGPVEWTRLAAGPVRGVGACAHVAGIIDNFEPDVVHLHNPYPLISPAVIHVAKQRDVAVVHTVHNYRHVCAKGTFFRDGRVCEDCRGRTLPWPAVAHGCYRGSRPQSVAMAVALTVHRSAWRRVDLFLAVSSFVADHLAREGIPRERIRVKPNPVPDPGPPTPPGDGFLFVGRLDVEKGILLLLHAWEQAGIGHTARLTVAGRGPLQRIVEDRAATLEGVDVVGYVAPETVTRLMREHAVVVVPSLWHEPFGLVVAEAFANGRPVVTTGAGALATSVDEGSGWVTGTDTAALADTLRSVAGERDLAARGRRARARYEHGDFRDPVPRLLKAYRSVA